MAKALMIQGTMSGAGKSLLCAAFCRIFHQDGYRVAPFKSQNMALNSFITEEGLEMGRAQVMQAEAAGIRPSVNMNPILLKPTSDCGSQVIVHGEVLDNMRARDYFKYKKKLVPDILKAYQTLAADQDIIVIEGAGSPAEINLKQDDIVNMGMAAMAHAPVLLVGDIDRGGVFASLYGTVALLEEEERRRIKGLIINKFRGDESILAPGYPMLEKLTGIPVLGSVPMMHLDLEDEDSVADRLCVHHQKGMLQLAVIRLPHISNFTDFHALEQTEGVTVSYVSRPEECEGADCILIPGSKNTLEDLKWMRSSGMEGQILRQHARNIPIIGICGGYQMLGEWISDPEGVEHGGALRGLGLLPIRTTFHAEKVRTQNTGRILPLHGFYEGLSGKKVTGYQIHQGTSVAEKDGTDFLMACDGKNSGMVSDRVFGTYLHGIFDETGFRSAFLEILLKEKGMTPDTLTVLDYQQEKKRQYDLLAQTVRDHLDMEKIYRIVEEGAL